MKQTAVEWLAKEINGVDTAVAYHYFKEKVKQAKEIENKQKHESIEIQVAILKDTLEEMMTGFDSEENKMDFILDICNGYKKRISN